MDTSTAGENLLRIRGMHDLRRQVLPEKLERESDARAERIRELKNIIADSSRAWVEERDRLQSELRQHGNDARETIENIEAENAKLREAADRLIIGACAVAVPHAGERAVLQEAVDFARQALAGKDTSH